MRELVVPGVHEIQLQRVKAHAILDDEGVTLIDTGYAGSLPRIERGLADLGRSVSDVRRVVCTHGHPDHAGSARALADLGIEVDIHPADAANLDIGFGDAVRRPSRGRIFAAMTPPLERFTPLEFKAGAGLIAVEGGTPIVPVKINIHSMSWIDRRRWPSPLRGDVELVLGDPLVFDADTDHAAATTRLEAAVAAL